MGANSAGLAALPVLGTSALAPLLSTGTVSGRVGATLLEAV